MEEVEIAQYNIVVHTHKICKYDASYIHLRSKVSTYLLEIFDYISQNALTIIKQAHYLNIC